MTVAHASLATIAGRLLARGVTRRALLKLCAALAASLALPAGEAGELARTLAREPRPRVLWLGLQGCTGCTESAIRSDGPSLESLILDSLSLDYHTTLMAAAGGAALSAIARPPGEADHVLIVEGSIPGATGACTTGGEDDATALRLAARDAWLILAVGSCAAFGGLPAAAPNPTGATGVARHLAAAGMPLDRLVNLPGCPPLAQALTGTLLYCLTYRRPPPLDRARRPVAFYGETVHERCSRLPHYRAHRFARSFAGADAGRGWCLLRLGCRGPVTANACARLGWNAIDTYPMRAGHGCIGCAQPGFWDRGGLYEPQRPTGRGGRGR